MSFALHYRNCPANEGMGLRLLALLQPIADQTSTRLLEGKQVIEVAPAVLPDKGTALMRLVSERGVRGVVFLGDDLADAAAFRELKRHRETRAGVSLSVAVVDTETPTQVRQAADVAIHGVGDVERFLTLLAERLP